MPIQVECSCGRALRVRDDLAGKKIRCPGCQGVMTVPAASDDEEEAVTAAPPRPKAAPAKTRPVRRPVDEDEDEQEQEETPRGRRTPPVRNKKSMLPWVAAIAAVVLIAGGVTAWLVWPKGTDKPVRRGGDTVIRPNLTDAANTIPVGNLPADLALVPRDAVGFVSVRVADWWNSELGKQAQALVGLLGGLEEMKKQTGGLTPADIERVTVVAPEPTPNAFVLVAANKPFDQQKIVAQLVKNGRPMTGPGGKTYHANRQTAVYFPGDKLMVAGPPGGLQAFFQRSLKPAASGPMSEALQIAAGNKHHLVLSAVPPPQIMEMVKQEFQKPGVVPPPLAPAKDFLDLNALILTADLGKNLEVDVRLTFPDEGKARAAQAAAKQLIGTARQMLAGFKAQFAKGPEAAQIAPLFDQADQTLAAIPVEQQGPTVHLALKVELKPEMLAGLMVPATQKVREAAQRAESQNNLRQLALGLVNYADENHLQMPPAVFRGGLSWRVAILPYIEQKALYDQFKLDEPWDSPHNIKLLTKMPKVFAHPRAPKGTDANSTYYQVFTGPAAPFNGNKTIKYPAGFQDGTSQTLLVVEAGTAVPWTKPADIPYDAKGPVPKLGGLFPGTFLGAMADGSVSWFDLSKLTEKTLRAAITPAGNEVLGPDFDQARGR